METADRERMDNLFAYTSRDACEQALRDLFSRDSSHGAVIKLYLRNFASFNNTFGYRQGEALLRQVADWLIDQPGCEVFRFGSGVSYVILLENADPVAATTMAQTIIDRFQQPWPIGQIDYICSVDIAVVLYPDYAASPDDLLRNLDLAIAQNAKAGPNQITLFGPALQERLYRNSIIARMLVGAIASGNIELRCRPVFCAALNRYTRIECQDRLLTVEFGPVKSSEFMPIAEESGIICFVNLYVIRRSCELIRQLLDSGCDFESMSVQISPVLFLQHNFISEIADIIAEYEIPAGKLAMEIFESPISSPVARVIIDRLKALGVEIVLGGFDFGYSGFKDILSLPIDALKLGRGVIWQLETNPRSGPVIEALIHAANCLNIKLIAEGVETEQQNSLLGRYKCPYRQGFYYSPSVEFGELRELLISQ